MKLKAPSVFIRLYLTRVLARSLASSVGRANLRTPCLGIKLQKKGATVIVFL